MKKRNTPGAKTIKKNTNSTQNKSQTHRAKQYEVTSFLSTDCELSTETCSKNVYSLGPRSYLKWLRSKAQGFFRTSLVFSFSFSMWPSISFSTFTGRPCSATEAFIRHGCTCLNVCASSYLFIYHPIIQHHVELSPQHNWNPETFDLVLHVIHVLMTKYV